MSVHITRRFDNEHGDAVNISVVADADRVRMEMRDQHSTMENLITRKEAEEIHAALGEALAKPAPLTPEDIEGLRSVLGDALREGGTKQDSGTGAK